MSTARGDAELASVMRKILANEATYVDVDGGCVLLDTSWVRITEDEQQAIKDAAQEP